MSLSMGSTEKRPAAQSLIKTGTTAAEVENSDSDSEGEGDSSSSSADERTAVTTGVKRIAASDEDLGPEPPHDPDFERYRRAPVGADGGGAAGSGGDRIGRGSGRDIGGRRSRRWSWRRARGACRCFCDWMYPLSAGSRDSAGAAAGSASAVRLDALDAPRWVASIQIVLYHMYGHEEGFKDTASWFANWTQFFFMLSGFVLAYAELARPPKKGKKLSVLQYVRRRLTVIYPAFAFSLILTIAGAAPSISRVAFEWYILPLHVLLMQSWLPICRTEHWGIACSPWLWNGEAWFLSVLVLYWLILRPLAEIFRRRSLMTCVVVIGLCWAFSYVISHYVGHNTLAQMVGCSQDLCRQMIVVAFRAGPAGYLHVFIAGIASARVFILSAMYDADTDGPPTENTKRLALCAPSAPFILRYGCVLGYALYAYFVLFQTERINTRYYFFHQGGLLPVMFLVLIGAAVGEDPLAAWVFKSKPFLVLGRISYLQYLMQHLVYHWVVHAFGWTGNPVAKWGFIPGLILFSYFCQLFVERPYTEYQRWRQEKGIKGCDDTCIEAVDAFVERRCSCCSRGAADEGSEP